MNTHPHPAPAHLLRSRPCIAMALLSTMLAFQARANVDVDLVLWHGYDFFYGDVGMVATNPAPVTYHRVESPNGLIWQNTGSDNSGSSASLSLTNDLAVLLNEVTNGLWSLTLNVGDASEEQYAFSISVDNVTTGLFGNALISAPAYASTVATNPPLIEWTGPSHLPTLRVTVSEANPPYTYGDSANLPSTATNWTPSVPLSPVDQSVFLNYRSNDFVDIVFSTPTNLAGGASPAGWTATGDISTYHYTRFFVPGGGSDLGDAVDAPELTWTTGGDADWFAQTDETSDGVDAAQSGPIGDFETSWIETTIDGPGILSFSWGIFADENDYLEVEWNGYPDTQIDGEWGWDTYEIFLDPGPNTIRWTFYNEDPTGAGLWDAGFLDEVVYEPEAYHEAELELNIQRNTQGGSTHYSVFPHLAYSNPYASVDSPNGMCSGDETSASSAQFATLQDAIDEIEAGPWTIFFDDGASSTEYYFGITVDSLTTNDLPPVLVLDPPDGATGVSTNTGYAWLGDPSFDSLTVSVRDVENSVSLGFANLPATETIWTNGPALPSGTNGFSAAYTSFGFLGLTIDEPMDDFGNPPAFWDASVNLTIRGYSRFVAGSGLVPVVLLPPELLGGDLALSFVSQSGAFHFVEYNTNLVDGFWMPATNFPGDGTTNQITLPTTNRAAYYRILTQ